MSKTFTDLLRDKILKEFQVCAKCGLMKETNYRQLAKDTGVPISTLYRFIGKKKPVDSKTIDKLTAYLKVRF